MDEIYARMPEGVIGVEDWMRGDFLAYYLDEETGQRYSRNGYPIAEDEMCREGGTVHKVEVIRTGDGQFDYKFKILSSRLDSDSMPCDTTSM